MVRSSAVFSCVWHVVVGGRLSVPLVVFATPNTSAARRIFLRLLFGATPCVLGIVLLRACKINSSAVEVFVVVVVAVVLIVIIVTVLLVLVVIVAHIANRIVFF